MLEKTTESGGRTVVSNLPPITDNYLCFPHSFEECVEIAKKLGFGAGDVVALRRGIDTSRSTFRPTLEWLRRVAPHLMQYFKDQWESDKYILPSDPGFVYLLHAKGTNYFKIGKTNNPHRRIGKEISPKMPFECALINVWATDHMSVAEKAMHQRLSEFRTNGEWFDLPAYVLEELELGEYQHVFDSARILKFTWDIPCQMVGWGTFNSISTLFRNLGKKGKWQDVFFDEDVETVSYVYEALTKESLGLLDKTLKREEAAA